MYLIVDFGNTRTKSACFENGELLKVEVHEHLDDWKEWVKSVSYDEVIISNVAHKKTVESLLPAAIVLTYKLHFPFQNNYTTPDTLGVDRLALVTGARSLMKETQPILVIDLGTCITYDFLDAENIYQGGSISPGVALRAKSMHTFTQSLPLVNGAKATSLVGKSTEEALQSGIYNGVLAEINGVIGRYKNRVGQLEVYLSGGDAELFESKINHSIFVQPNLALIGLNKILELNAE